VRDAVSRSYTEMLNKCWLQRRSQCSQLLLERAIAHLLEEDVGIPRLVDLEGFAAVGADDFVHGGCGAFVVLVVQITKPPVASL